MRTKRRVVKPRFCTSPLPPPSSSPNFLKNRNDDDSMIETSSSRNERNGSALDWLDGGETCLICGEAGHLLLVCSHADCPISLHEACMERKPSFDDATGKFYCPYCWYKRQVVEAKELRKKNAMLANIASSCFAAPGIAQCIGDPARNQINQVEADCRNKEDGIKLADCGQLGEAVNHNAEDISATPEFNSVEVEEVRQGMDDGQVDDDQNETVVDEEELLQEPACARCVEEGIDIQHGICGAIDANRETIEFSKDNQDRRNKERQMQQIPMDTTSAGALLKTTQLPDSDNQTIIVTWRRVKRKANKKPTWLRNADSLKKTPPQSHTTSERNRRKQKKGVSPQKMLKRHRESAKDFTNLTFADGKRKRLHWTAEEEDMLKEGVRKFSTTMNKNIPWRKILEFGGHVFDATRNPTDLKDKWKNIMGRGQ